MADEYEDEQVLAFLAQEINSLSLKEHETILHDIHGVPDIVEEDPDLVQTCLDQLDQHFEQETTRKLNTTTLTSTLDHPEHIHIKDLRLIFLRRFDFDAEAAAHCMLRHFQLKLELFGREKVYKKITLDDLSPDDLNCLKNGHCQLLSQRDSAGRAILCSILPFLHYTTVESQIRAAYYILWMALQDEETQRLGCIGISYNIKPISRLCAPPEPAPAALDRQFLLRTGKLLEATPIRLLGTHFCFNDACYRPVATLTQRVLNRFIRLRSRLHFGSQQECFYALMTFGISVRALPLTNEGRLERHHFLKLLEMRCRQEGSNQKTTVVIPARYDVLFGRGRTIQEHSGVLRLHYLIDTNMELYENASRKDKTTIAKHIVRFVKDSPGRFLKEEDGLWTIVSDDVAREKVSHTFRSRRNAATVSAGGNSKKRKGSSDDEEP